MLRAWESKTAWNFITVVAACVVFNCLPCSIAYPEYWYASEFSPALDLPGFLKCDAHPTVSLEPDLSPHGKPKNDSAITFIFYNTGQILTQNVFCPGATYTLKVTFTESRLALLTANNVSEVAFTAPTPTPGCSNRVDLGNSVRASMSFNATFKVPCRAAGKVVQFRVTSAEPDEKAWKQSSVQQWVSSGAGPCAVVSAGCGLPPVTTLTPPIAQSRPPVPSPVTAPPKAQLRPPVPSPATAPPKAQSRPPVPSPVIAPPTAQSRPPVPSPVTAPPTAQLRPPVSSPATAPPTPQSRPPVPSPVIAPPTAQLRPPVPSPVPALSGPPTTAPPRSNPPTSTPPATKPSPSPPATLMSPAFNPPLPLSPSTTKVPTPPSRLCNSSSLGYQCMVTQGRIILHWSVNSSSAPAANGCTPRVPTTLTARDLLANGSLHMAVQAGVTGYVGIGFPLYLNYMYPADIVFGWVPRSGSPYIRTFFANDHALSASNEYPAPGTPSWAYDMGASQVAANGEVVTTICFSRRLQDSRPQVSPLLLTNGTLTSLNYAVSSLDGFVTHTPTNVDSFRLNLSKGKVPPP